MAETPPPYMPRKKSSTTTVIFIILGICAVCCIVGVVAVAGIGWFGFKKSRNFISCTMGFAQTTEAMKAYVRDHDGKLPKADDWQTALKPYLVKEQQKDDSVKILGSFDPDGVWMCKDDSGQGMNTGIAFNSDLSGQKLSDIKNKGETIILFEVPKTGMNLSEPYVELSKSSSPKIGASGQPRGWFRVSADYEIRGVGNANNININTSD